MSALAENQPALKKPSPVTVRSVTVGLLLSVGCGLIVPYMDHYMRGTFIGGQHLPPGAVFMLMMLVLIINPLLRLISRRLAFSQGELLVVYAMLLISTLIPSHGGESVFVPVSVSAFYYATPANRWAQLFFQYIPDWFTLPKAWPSRRSTRGSHRAWLSPGENGWCRWQPGASWWWCFI